jgi:hypothetical protein
MKLLILSGSLHHKNKIGLEMILNHIDNTVLTEISWNNRENIDSYDIIYSSSEPIDTSKYPDKKFIFGPHFSVFPTQKLKQINNVHKNSIYIQPSEWVVELWKNMHASIYLPIKQLPFPVDIFKFSPIDNIERSKVFIYFKRRKPDELEFIKNELMKRNIEYRIFDYVKRYDEIEYIKYLQESKFGIILDAHESQGFAIEEALSCNVPLLVWNTKYMSQEHGANYPDIPCTTIPYWDERCGEYFYESHEFEKKFDTFINKLERYEPRKYIEENLSIEKCSEKFLDLLN